MANPLPDYSIGFTQVEVEAIFAAQKAELAKVLAAYSEGGSSVTKRQIADIHLVLTACQKALQKLDPTTYPMRRRVAVSTVSHIAR